MSQQTSYATVSAAGAGVLDAQASVAEYVYDAHSQSAAAHRRARQRARPPRPWSAASPTTA